MFSLLLSFSVLPLAAESFSDYGLAGEYGTLADGIPEAVRPYLPDGAGGTEDIAEVGETVQKMTAWDYILDVSGHILSVEWGAAARLFGTMAGMVLLCAGVESVVRTFCAERMHRVFGMGLSLLLFTRLLTFFYEQMERVRGLLDGLAATTTAFLPILTALHALGGATTTAAVQNGGLLTFLSLVGTVCNRTILPVSAICLSLTLTGTLSQGNSLGGLARTVKNGYTGTLAFLLLVLGFVMSSQTALAAATDSLGARAAKFVSARLIPVTGGAVGDSLRTLSAGVVYLKNTVGVGAVAVMFLLVLPVIVSLFLNRLTLGLCAALAELLGCERERKMLSDFQQLYGMLLAVISLCVLLFVFSMILFVRSSVAW